MGGFDGKFNPEDPVTREEMAAILHRYAAYKAYDVSDTATGQLPGWREDLQLGSRRYEVGPLAQA